MEIYVDESFRDTRIWLYQDMGCSTLEFLVLVEGQIQIKREKIGASDALPPDCIFISGNKTLLQKAITLLCSHAISQNMPVPQKDFLSGQLDAQKSQISDFKEIILSIVQK
jgi:hypothetical protein